MRGGNGFDGSMPRSAAKRPDDGLFGAIGRRAALFAMPCGKNRYVACTAKRNHGIRRRDRQSCCFALPTPSLPLMAAVFSFCRRIPFLLPRFSSVAVSLLPCVPFLRPDSFPLLCSCRHCLPQSLLLLFFSSLFFLCCSLLAPSLTAAEICAVWGCFDDTRRYKTGCVAGGAETREKSCGG